MNLSQTTRLVALAVLMGVTGCSTLVPKEDPTRYYVLKANSTGSLASGQNIAVGVGPVTIPGYLERDEITTAGPASSLNVAEFHVWGESLDKGITHVVARNMSRLLNSPAVVPFPDADTKIDYQTGIVIRRFAMGDDNKVHLEASYFVEGAPGSTQKGTARSKNIVVKVSQPDNYDAIVHAMSNALASLSNSMAREVLSLSRKR